MTENERDSFKFEHQVSLLFILPAKLLYLDQHYILKAKYTNKINFISPETI